MTETYSGPKSAWLLFLFAGVKGLLFALLIPPGQGPDEPGHVAHILLYARQAQFSIIGQNDPGPPYQRPEAPAPHLFWNSAVQADSKVFEDIFAILQNDHFWTLVEATPPMPQTLTAATRPDLIEYIALRRYTSPLYFFIVALPLKWFGGQNTLSQWFFLRLLSVTLGVGVCGLTYATARLVWPRDSHWPALAAATFVAFLPQFSFLSAVVSPDLLLIFLSSAVLYTACKLVTGQGTEWQLLSLIGLGGLCVLVKEHGIPIFLFVLLVLSVFARPMQLRHLLSKPSLRVCLGGLVGVEIVSMYYWGNPEAFGHIHHFVQTHMDDLGSSFFAPPAVYARFFLIIFVSFWFSYGWMVYKMSLGWYAIFACLSLVGLLGLGRALWRGSADLGFHLPCVVLSLMLFMACFTAVLGILGPHEGMQARHFFAALPAIAILLTLGLWGATPGRYRLVMLQGFMLLMVFVNMVVVSHYLIPLFYGRSELF